MTYAAGLFAFFVLAVAAWRDVATRTIPDAASWLIGGIGIGARGALGFEALAVSLAGATLLFLTLFLFFARGFLGGGDVKLASAIAVGLAPAAIWEFVVATTFAGGVLAILHLLLRRWGPARFPGRVGAVEAWRIRRGAPLPYGVAIAVGGTFVLLGHP
ncbi:A24 family peptidase [Sabulicella glaciei]|uniref:Prepilin peptidase n=1 Tax=Sabulicella glaciei TaxID=2984948 RepID=A0ABT3NQ85_9PROT|nr:prepilin peptidase [Roseococcus sp. MDT2-1-1]MCW8084321.1 prepilin peptidase [Roseococcus sp. MDT2-1-1]